MSVLPGGPAAQAGLRPTRRDESGEIVLGDVIVAINDHKVHTLDDVYAALETVTVGQTVTVSVLRDGDTQKIPVKLGPSLRLVASVAASARREFTASVAASARREFTASVAASARREFTASVEASARREWRYTADTRRADASTLAIAGYTSG